MLKTSENIQDSENIQESERGGGTPDTSGFDGHSRT
jgi:hypothetical protein